MRAWRVLQNQSQILCIPIFCPQSNQVNGYVHNQLKYSLWSTVKPPHLFDVQGQISQSQAKLQVIVITQDKYDILVITRIRGEAEDEC